MKIKKAFDICKKTRAIITFFIDDLQWLSNGQAAYLIDEAPTLSEEYICRLYDISDKQREKIHFKIQTEFSGGLCMSDNDGNEVEAKPMNLGVELKGIGHCLPFFTESGVIFVQRQYLTPLLDVPENELLFYCRTSTDGKLYIAVKVGLLLCAVIAPIRISDDVVNDLQYLYKAAQLANENQRQNDE